MIRRTRAQAVIIRQGHILMARHFDIYIGQEYWCLPGGGVEAGETPEQAVIRELLEETGYTIRIKAALGQETFPEVMQGYAATVTYWAEVADGSLHLGYDPEQADWDVKFLQEVRWLPLDGDLLMRVDRFFLRRSLFVRIQQGLKGKQQI